MNIARKSRTLELRLAPQLRFPQANGRGCRSGHAQRACRSPGLRRVFLTHTITLLAAHSLRSTTLRCHACCSYLCRPLPGLSNTHTHYNDRLAASRAGFPGLAAHFRWPNVLADNALNVVSYASVTISFSGSLPAPRVPTRDRRRQSQFQIYTWFLDGCRVPAAIVPSLSAFYPPFSRFDFGGSKRVKRLPYSILCCDTRCAGIAALPRDVILIFLTIGSHPFGVLFRLRFP